MPDHGRGVTSEPGRGQGGTVFVVTLIAVIGPPGAGKSTVVAAMTSAHGVRVFRLREGIRTHPELLAGLAQNSDPLGWVSIEAVRRVVRAVFVEDGFGLDASAVLLDNFPGTAEQLDLLPEIAEAITARLAVLELRAATRTVMQRVAQRRVCLTCGPDAHSPALPAANDPECCGFCGMALISRDTDVPHVHRLRLARYAANRPEIAERASELRIPYMTLNADAATPLGVCRAAHQALHRLTDPAEHPRSRP